MTTFKHIGSNGSLAHPQCAAQGCTNTDIIIIEVETVFRERVGVELRPPLPSTTRTRIRFTPCAEHREELMEHLDWLGFHSEHITITTPDETRRRQERDLRAEEEANEYRRQRSPTRDGRALRELTPEEAKSIESNLGIRIIPRRGKEL